MAVVLLAHMTVRAVENDWLVYGALLTIVGIIALTLVSRPWTRWWRGLTDKTRKWTRRGLYAGVTLAAIVWGLFIGLIDVLGQWSAGRGTEDVRLGFTTMLSWGRVGKGLQFIAGLVVLLDLVPADTLRKIGKRAGMRLRGIDPKISERRSVNEYLAAERWLCDNVITHETALGPRNEQWTGPPTLAAEAKKVPPGAPYTWEEYLAVRQLFVDVPIDHEQKPRLASMARELVERGLSREQVKRLRRARRWRAFVNDKIAPVAVVLFLAWFVASVGGLMPTGDWYSLLVGLVGMGIAGVMAVQPGALYESWLQIIYFPVRLITEWQANLLDRDPPAHPLRWLAFWIFIYGFVLDLLAS
ncbi:hypothetical protein ACTWPT_09300 [Nonomuraea sp. 3N208]|uniref:hypothetical protein n=1 Tax=Nonomuraea sp. 3N208 TaxID=3457421 RepID=UPI003FCD0534